MARTISLVALAACIALGAFAVARLTAPRPSESSSPRTGGAPARIAAESTPQAQDRGIVDLPPSAEPLAEVYGQIPRTTLGLLSLRRAGPKVLVVSVRVTADRGADAVRTQDMRFDRPESAIRDASAMELRDAATGRAIRPALNAAGECDCSPFDGLHPGDSADVGATFRMPTAEGPFVLRVPGFPEIAGITPAEG